MTVIIHPVRMVRYATNRWTVYLVGGPESGKTTYAHASAVAKAVRNHMAADFACGRDWECACAACRFVRSKGWR